MESGFGSNEKNAPHPPPPQLLTGTTGTSACRLIGLFEKLATRTRVESLGITKVRAKLISDLSLSSLFFPKH